MLGMVSDRSATIVDRGLHVAGGVILAGLLLGAGWAWWLVQREIKSLDNQRQESVDFFERADEVRGENAALAEQVRRTERQYEAALARVPNSPDESRFLENLSALAAETRLEIRDYRPGSTVQQERSSAIEVQIHTDGEYEQVCRFLAGLANLPRMCKVSQVGISGPAAPGGSCALDVNLQLIFAPKLEPAAKAKPETP